ncbi:callose synthase 7-like [Phragmites australis]|uniref:callose synthase 7-like n=1 Tax=Phragmites australis TaxID=29695 RepID=UPI002D7808FA|nr:callose synthase 7-like [Phragmites australis]
MAATSGGELQWLSRALTMPPDWLPGEEGGETSMDETERVPSSLKQDIGPILSAAKEIEDTNHRVAYLCRFLAFQRAHTLDPNSTGRGVRQFKTYLIHRLEKDEPKIERKLASTDSKEIMRFYEEYKSKYRPEDLKKNPEEMARHYEIASVLLDVLKAVTPKRYDPESDEYAKGLGKDKASFPYNILPLNISNPTQPVMEIPEIKAAVELLRNIDNLPKPRTHPTSASEEMDGPIVGDLFDWLWQTFGFQKSNVENQKEHLILLLANIDMRKGGNTRRSEIQNHVIHSDIVTSLTRKIFQNYISWCQYLQLESNIKIPHGCSTQQPEILYIGLYLLIWGEASNVRFMPECLCYIFHYMARDLYGIISNRREDSFDISFRREGIDDVFLQLIIQPIFNVMQEEAAMSKRGTTSHSKWRNYDDLNEYFWSKKCFEQLKWPMDLTADFFVVPTKSKNETEKHANDVRRWRIPKTNFVEHRSFFLLLRSFDRMWTFFILAFQAMVIIAWNPSGSLYTIFEPTVFRNVVTIFITYAFLNFLQATFEIILNWKAWKSLECSEIVRYILKFVIALAWLIILPTTYISSIQNPTGLVKFFGSWIGNSQSESIYNFAVALYMLPNIFNALFFIFLPFRRALERSNSRIVRFLLWWSQPKLYVARGMYEDTCSLLKYILFWTILLICKLAFSFYVEISPLVGPTRKIMLLGQGPYEHGFFPYLQHNLGVVITVWVPSAMVYFMDTQIWYVLFSTICGGLSGALSGLGEIRTPRMLRSRFQAIPKAFVENLVPKHDSQPNRSEREDGKKNHIDEFSDIWNAFIISLRDEDLISNRERNLLMAPSSTAMGETTVFQWPPFLLASKIPLALEMAKRAKKNDEELTKRISEDPYTYCAVIECYETLLNILYSLINQPSDKKVIDQISDCIKHSILRQSVVNDFCLEELPRLSAKFDMLLDILRWYHEGMEGQIAIQLQDIMEMITHDIIKNGQGILKDETIRNEHFAHINLDSVKGRAWSEKCARLQLLLTTKESAIYVPTNFEAQRRITFFANSFFMKMPRAPQVRSMMSFSVLTPYFAEEVLFSEKDLYKKNEDGISILFYLRKIYPDEWINFLERIDFNRKDEESLKSNIDEICPWASYRGQTLIRTVRGMMYYRRALEIQCIQDKADLDKLDHDEIVKSSREARAIADIKFTYVVSCQAYGMQRISKDHKDRDCYLKILNLMTTYPSLRVAYIDEVEAPTDNGMTKTYYSVLVKGAGRKYDQEIYRIKLPGEPTNIGERKPENQNHAIIFTRGEALQAIDMNQDNYLEEAFKMRNLLEEFESEKYGKNKPTILGLREHIFTGSVSSLARFMSIQDTSFVTIGQRILANVLKVRFHYGHSDIFDRLFHITRGGISKASKTINLSEGIFSGFNSIMRGGNVTHHEYMQVGKGRDVGMNQISSFEANVANGNGEQTLSRDIYRLGHRFDFYRMLSVYFTTVGFYFNSMVSVLTVYVFLYGRLYLVISGLEKSILLDQHTQENIKPLERALASESFFQLGLLLVLPMFMEAGLEKGFSTALGEFVIMQLQLASVFFTFQLGTKTHYYARTILHGGAKYRPTSSGFVVCHTKFAENYRMYSRSHFFKGLELLILLVVYLAYGSTYDSSSLYLFLTFSIWLLVVSWLFAPFIFNPSCFEWQKIVDDWADWKKWMGNRGIAVSVDQSWEVWWESEQEHLRKTSIHALVLEIILSLRFLIYQCGIVYYLNIAHPGESILVYASWLVMLLVLVVLKMDSTAQQKFRTDLQLMFRILKALVFLGSVIAMAVLFVVGNLTISDVFVSILGFVPTGWCILLIGQACSPLLKRTMLWDSIMELGRAYDNMMGLVLFLPIVLLSWFPSVSEFQTRLLFNPGFIQGLQISRILAGQRDIGDIE